MDPSELKADAMRLGMQAAMMRELLHSAMWTAYAESINEMMEDWMERVLTGTKEEFEFRKGVITGLRHALRLPTNIIDWAEKANRN